MAPAPPSATSFPQLIVRRDRLSTDPVACAHMRAARYQTQAGNFALGPEHAPREHCRRPQDPSIMLQQFLTMTRKQISCIGGNRYTCTARLHSQNGHNRKESRNMPTPKQIIYPLRYLRATLLVSPSSEIEFKDNFAHFLGDHVFVIPVGRARGGIYLLTKVAITEQRRKVILSPYTIPDVINMVRFAGGEPVFVDSLANSTNIDLDQLAALLDDKTACVFITHYHVNQNQTGDLVALCKERGIMLFDDCALSLGGDFEGTSVGRVTDASVFSMSGFKVLNFFWGGAITTTSQSLAKTLSAVVETWPRLRISQYKHQMLKILKYDLATREFLFSHFLFPVLRSRINHSEVQDVLPLSRIESRTLEDTVTSRPAFAATTEWNRKISSVERFIIHRRRIASVYDRHLAHRAVSGETKEAVRRGSCYVNYPVWIETEHRNEVYRDLLGQGFDVGLSLYPNVHETLGFHDIQGRSGNVSALVRSVITLPSHPRISEAYAQRIARAMTSTLANRGLA